MTDRDTFAAAALTGLLHHNDIDASKPVGWWVEQAYDYADAMLRERGNRQVSLDGSTDHDEIERLRGDAEIARLRLHAAHNAIRRLAEQDATLSVQGGNVTVTMDASLTAQEREALTVAAIELNTLHCSEDHYSHVIRSLLERLK